MNENSSFIPRQKTPVPQRTRRVHRRVYVLSYIVYTIFFGALLTVGGLFVWEWQLQKGFDIKKQQLTEERSQFNQSDIERVRELHTQLVLVEKMLDQHPSVSKVFSALEESTLQSIQIRNFDIIEAIDDNDMFLITFTGAADNFDAVLFQRDVLQGNALLSEARVVDVTYGNAEEDNSNDLITYRVTISLPFSSIPYTGREIEPVFEDVNPEGLPSEVDELDDAQSASNEETDTAVIEINEETI